MGAGWQPEQCNVLSIIGLSESILAAALSRIGRSVLHLDRWGVFINHLASAGIISTIFIDGVSPVANG